MTEEQALGKNEHWYQVWPNGNIWDKTKYPRPLSDDEVAIGLRNVRMTLIESAKLAKVREALENIWEILHHEGFDETADYCTRTLAELEPPQ